MSTRNPTIGLATFLASTTLPVRTVRLASTVACYPLTFDLYPSPFNPYPFLKLFAQAGWPVVGLPVVGVTSCPDVVAEAREGFAQPVGEIGVGPHELCGWRKTQAQQVVQHQDLTVAVGSGADADGWDPQALGNDGGEF